MERYDSYRRGRYDRDFRGGSWEGGRTGYSRGSDGYPWGVNLNRVEPRESGGGRRPERPRRGSRGEFADIPRRGSGAAYDAPYREGGGRGRRGGYGDRDYSPWLSYVPREYDRGYRW